jgi:RNA 2',3'-cyclic 3'-phosphodiesterase
MAQRLFAAVAVAASEALRKLMRELQAELRDERIRWDRLENPHGTLWFFGDTGEERIPELERALAAAAAEMPAFTMAIRGLGLFGSAQHPSVVWLGIESGTGLKNLFEAMAARLGEVGWAPEKREFLPHLTLGRISGLRDARRFAETLERYREVVVQEQAVTELILYESLLRRGGAEHVPLGRYALSDRTGANRA